MEKIKTFLLTLNLLYFLNGLVRLPFLRTFHYQFWGFEVGQPTLTTELLRLHGCAGWPGSDYLGCKG